MLGAAGGRTLAAGGRSAGGGSQRGGASGSGFQGACSGSGRWWRGRQRWAGRRIGGERGSAGTHALRAATLLTSTIVRYRPGTVRLQLGGAALPERSAFRQTKEWPCQGPVRPDPTPLLSLSRLDFSCVPVCVCVSVCVFVTVREREREPKAKSPTPLRLWGTDQYSMITYPICTGDCGLVIYYPYGGAYTIAFNYKAVPEQ